MKLSAATTVLLSLYPASAVFTPKRIAYEVLASPTKVDTDQILDVLGTVGIISITGIPDLNKDALLQSLPDCIKNVGLEANFGDGTLRRTIATHSQGSHQFVADAPGDACASFQDVNSRFRERVAEVVYSFGSFLEKALSFDATSLLTNANDKEQTYSFMDIVEQGDHLEHFHAYYSSKQAVSQDNTISWHTDQGLMLAFSPGQANGHPTDGFYIQLPDGSSELVKFDDEDELVFLLW
jgi:hypothetical protein